LLTPGWPQSGAGKATHDAGGSYHDSFGGWVSAIVSSKSIGVSNSMPCEGGGTVDCMPVCERVACGGSGEPIQLWLLSPATKSMKVGWLQPLFGIIWEGWLPTGEKVLTLLFGAVKVKASAVGGPWGRLWTGAIPYGSCHNEELRFPRLHVLVIGLKGATFLLLPGPVGPTAVAA